MKLYRILRGNMRICLDIEFEKEIVCILGGGKLALRKAKQFLEAGSIIYISALAYEEEFDALPVHKVDRDQLHQALKEAKLAIACTDDESENRAFLKLARTYKVLTMAARKEQGQDTFSLTQLRLPQMVLASSTQGAFPAANRFLLQDWQRRLSILGMIREKLSDHLLCKALLNVTEEQLFFLQEALQNGCAIVYLLHGNGSFKAHRQCENLVQSAKEKWNRYAVTTFFLAKKYKNMDLETWCAILKDLNIQMHFVLIFWQRGNYVDQAEKILTSYSFSKQCIFLQPQTLVKGNQDYILHIQSEKVKKDSVVLSILDSPYMRKLYPDHRFIAAFDQEKQIERIVHETNPTV